MAGREQEALDIISLHHRIVEAFTADQEKLGNKRKTLGVIDRAINEDQNLPHSTRRGLEGRSKALRKEIEDVSSRKTESFYVMESSELVERFEAILKKPITVSFMGTQETGGDEKAGITKDFLRIVRKYRPEYVTSEHLHVPEDTADCKYCTQGAEIIEVEGVRVCVECGREEPVAANSSSYKDAERVNVGSKYTYDKRIHFRDCINQFQGKQNSNIPERVYESLESEFEAHGLLLKSKDKEIRFSSIKKEHILLFLKEGGFSKHYEDAVLIHYNLTGVKPPDISHLEADIVSDFDRLVEAYDTRFNKEEAATGDRRTVRKNFINNQYVLYQLLKKHSYPCDVSEFSILKTAERQSYHDDICRELFKTLGWNFTSVF